MIGWKLLEPLEDLDYSRPVPAGPVAQVVSDLRDLYGKLRARAIETLESVKKWKVAERLRTGYGASWDTFFNDYFSTEAWSYRIPASPPDSLDWKRSAQVLHLACTLSDELVTILAEVPEVVVANAEGTRNAGAFTLAHRHTTLSQVLRAIKSVQHELEDFEFILRELLVGTDGTTFVARGGKWPFDAEIVHHQVLLGFSPTLTPGLTNSNPARSAIVAAGIIRTFLESVVFRLDFESSLGGAQRTDGKKWKDALGHLRASDLLSESEATWVTKLYGVLSKVVHEGVTITHGETWAFGKLVNGVRDRLTARTGTRPAGLT